jgi:sarcosine oxidase subunit gamma
MLAKLCGVDLADESFSDGSVAQTSLARLSAIVIRNDFGSGIAFSILADSASAEYLWDCLIDAMDEFSGSICGIESL